MRAAAVLASTRASVRALSFGLCAVCFSWFDESDPSQDDSRECKVLLLLARTLGGEQRLHTATTTWRIGDHAASGTRTRHMHGCFCCCCCLGCGGGNRRHATRVLSCASGQITGSHEYTIVYQYRLEFHTAQSHTKKSRRPIDRIDSRETARLTRTATPRPSGDQEPSEAVTRTDTRPTHHQVAPRNHGNY